MRWGMPGALGASGPAALPDMAALKHAVHQRPTDAPVAVAEGMDRLELENARRVAVAGAFIAQVTTELRQRALCRLSLDSMVGR